MTDLLNVRDVSNWSGPITPAMLSCWQSENVVAVVVRASLERASMIALAKQQIAAVQGDGLIALGYCWLYGNQDPRAIIRQTAATYPMLNLLPPDFEDVASFGGMTSAQVQAYLLAVHDEMANVQKKGSLWYTARYVFQDLGIDGWTGLAQAGASMWDAGYNHVPDLASVLPFCGFDVAKGNIVAHQFDDKDACATSVDSSVFLASVFQPVPPPPSGPDIADTLVRIETAFGQVDALRTNLQGMKENLTV